MGRADLEHCVKHLAKHMQQPKGTYLQRLTRLGRYLKGKPRVVQVFTAPLRRADHRVKISVFSDNARRSECEEVGCR